jgi:Rhodopirellula transposase DDE domain
MSSVAEIREKYRRLSRVMDERSRRIWAATEASAAGWGGVSLVARATGMARNTVAAGVRELRKRDRPAKLDGSRVRRLGGGRKRLAEREPKVLKALEYLVAPGAGGKPEAALRWTCKSTRTLAEELGRLGYELTDRSVASLLKALDYQLPPNHPTLTGASHPDRDAQFAHINRQTLAFQNQGDPVIAVTARKRRFVADAKRGQLGPPHVPHGAQLHDPEALAHSGWVSARADRDTLELAVETIRRWWMKIGFPSYPRARALLIVADTGDPNGDGSALWKLPIQRFADDTRLKVSISHFPPGTCKWTKIEHRMLAAIAQNPPGRPAVSHRVTVNLIGGTAARARLKRAPLEAGQRAAFGDKWNYVISPNASA